MDIHIQLRKKDANGKLLSHYNYTKDEGGAMVPFIDPTVYDFEHVNILQYLGPTGVLRASHAVTYNESKSTENEPHYDHVSPLKEILPLVLPIDIIIPAGSICSHPSWYNCTTEDWYLAYWDDSREGRISGVENCRSYALLARGGSCVFF